MAGFKIWNAAKTFFTALDTGAEPTANKTFTLPSIAGELVIKDSPSFTGTPTAPTPTAGDNSTNVATTAFATTALTNLLSANNSFTGTNNFTTPPQIGGNNLTPFSGMKNRIINGDMRVWQMAISQSGTGYGSLDRFFAINGNSMTFTQSTDVPNSSFKYSTSVYGASNYPTIAQRIESMNCLDLVGNNITFSFWLKQTSGATTNSINWQLVTPNAVDNWTGVTVINSGSITGTTSWQYYTVTITNVDSSAANGLGLYISANTSGSATFLITGVQLEKGSVATPFENRPYGLELSLCQRYYETSYPLGNYAGAIITSGAKLTRAILSGAVGFSAEDVRFNTPKRTTPTITIYNPFAANNQIRNQATSTDCTSTSIGDIGNNMFTVNGVAPSNTAAGNLLRYHYTASAEL